MSSLVPSDHVLYRSPSNSSVASSSSGSSLARRPGIRARSRSRTVPKPVKSPPSELAYDTHGQHLRPPEQDRVHFRDLHGKASGSLQSSEGAALDVTMVADPQPSPMTVKLVKVPGRASSLPDVVATSSSPPSAFFRESCMTPKANVRDSVSTQQSGTSSSVYPLSISSASGPDSPTSLRTMSEDIEHFEVSSYEPEVEELPGFDPDDVSYRLRLLVKNNYFLPPAHSKPMLSELSPTDASKKMTRAATPTFFDIFRVNKSKSKPSSPTVDSSLPMLRATGDSIMAPHLLQPRTSFQIPRPSLGGAVNERVGRVVVVREKMEDLSLAAKQAEQEIKSRVHARRDLDIDGHSYSIDPTDAVDIPPLSPSYPFPMQTSTWHGLGVSESVGAAVLAEHLPPGSPGMSSFDPRDDWRKALLQEAVHHSLDNTPDLSTFSHALGASTPLQRKESHLTESPAPRILLQQRIIEQPFPDSSDDSFRDNRQENPTSSNAGPSKSPVLVVPDHRSSGQRVPSNRSSYLPARVETPTDPVTALTPPPPRKQLTAFISQSQTDLAANAKAEQPERECRTPTPTLRRTVSSPMLSDAYDSDILRSNRITPPPLPGLNLLADSGRNLDGSNDTSGNTNTTRNTITESMYSEDEFANASARQSTAQSIFMRRPSLSDYSHYSLSPTTSAFQEDLNNAHAYPSGTPTSPESQQSVQQLTGARNSPMLRDSAMSPPPRISSSLAHVALPPPPRVSSLRHPPLPVRRGSQSLESAKASLDSVMEFVAPEPTTPPLPISGRRGDPSTMPHTFQIPGHDNVDASLHSAPAPASPTSFFDSIQSQPNALDDLDSSSDESDVVHAAIFSATRSRTMSNVSPPSRSLLMRLGNHSTPYFSRTAQSTDDQHAPLPFGVQDPKQPIVNMPLRPPVFTRQKTGKSDLGHGAPASSFDFYKYSKQHPSGPSIDFSEPRRRPATAGETRSMTGKGPSKVEDSQESLRRLDGLMQQHMEAEKDTIKRIAKTLQSSNTQRTPSHLHQS
ncbi:hypothetical protein F5887DRAFT_1059811 [Amanita rubescens]|nr:hypothetical protein F5887DRAFT_1059811 [Amanita rubescens]